MQVRTESSIDTSMAGKLIEDLIGPSSDAIGTRLLKKMGWKEGQGIGSKKRKRRTFEGEKDNFNLNN